MTWLLFLSIYSSNEKEENILLNTKHFIIVNRCRSKIKMQCFLCRMDLDCVFALGKHFRKIHNLEHKSTFICYVNSCGQCFTNLSNYKRHILRLHCPTTSLKCIQEGNANSNTAAVSLPTSSNSGFEVSGSKTNGSQQMTAECINPNKFLPDFFNEALKFSTLLHGNYNFSRKDVYDIQKNVKTFLIDPLLDQFKTFAQDHLNNNIKARTDLMSLVFSCRDPFQYCGTDHNLCQTLKLNGCMDEIREFTIKSDIQPIYDRSELVYAEKICKGSVLPLKSQFRKIFEQENILLEVLRHMNSLYSNKQYTNFIQGPVWKKKCDMYPGKTLIPYFLYADDFAVNNPLGAHATTHSVCNFYYSFPCFPRRSSKLESIFLAAVIKSKDLKNIGNEDCLHYLIEELIYLEETGVDISVGKGEMHRVHFIMGLFLGDNLGVNSLLDFSKSFSSTSFCRFCKVDRENCSKLGVEVQEHIRTVENYSYDVSVNDLKKTGIAKESPFNKIPSFHVVENFCVDAMHDLCEGIFHYDLCHILLYLTQEMNYLTLEMLNKRKQTFDYGPMEIGNFSTELTMNHLKNKHLKMTAREMLTFVMYLPLMIGDLIPSEDEVWLFLLELIDITELILSFEVTELLISTLKLKIKHHNEQYVKLFTDNLKPKFHFLTHYPTVIRNSGPARNFWCFKFEAKHRPFKVYAHGITSRKNICLTLSKKFQFQFANLILHSNSNINEFHIEEKHLCDTGFANIVRDKLKLKEDKKLKFYDEIEYIGKKYKAGFYVGKCSNDYNIYIIRTIAKAEGNILMFCQKLLNIYFNSHFKAFEVDTNMFGEFKLLAFDEIIGPPVTLTKTSKGKHLIKLKEYFHQ